MYGINDTFLKSEIDYRTSRIRTGTAGRRRRPHGVRSRVRRPGTVTGGTR